MFCLNLTNYLQDILDIIAVVLVTFNTVYYYLKKHELESKVKREKDKEKKQIFKILPELESSLVQVGILHFPHEEETQYMDNDNDNMDLKSISSHETVIIEVKNLNKSSLLKSLSNYISKLIQYKHKEGA